MKTKEDILQIVQKVIEQLNENEERIGCEIPKEPETRLIGYNSQLDSLGLIILIVGIEQEIDTVFKIKITIADDKAMSEKHSPFKSIDSLTEYVLGLVNAKEK
jgi:acyl carrier protein